MDKISVNQPNTQSASIEYVVLVALAISIAALGTDLMLPALDTIGSEFEVSNPNNVHLIVTTFFLGMAFGQIFVGPLSDSIGRKPVILTGYMVFIAGCILSIFATSWTMLLIGRVLQGIGAAAPRVVAVAMVRDEFEGRQMARILSIVMALFIVVPMLAPAIGQVLVYIGQWQATFVGLIGISVIASIWFQVRQPETLDAKHRRSFRLSTIYSGLIEVITSRIVMGYSIASGLVFGMFIGYLGSSQQIFQSTFNVGDWFVVYFALASTAIGAASLVNSKLVIELGMRKLTSLSLLSIAVISFVFWGILLMYDGIPPLFAFVLWQLLAFFCVGIVFGNLSSLSLEPLGHMAGLGAAFVGSVSLFISLPLAWLIGHLYDGTVIPLVAGFALLSFIAWAVAKQTEHTPN